jgi:hypothetical protein
LESFCFPTPDFHPGLLFGKPPLGVSLIISTVYQSNSPRSENY